MAEAVATNPGMDRYNRYYNTVLAQLQQDMGPERSDSQLKNYLMRLIRPSYDQAIAQRQQQTGQANAAIDTDAASRGMGTSTWVTDAKNRQRNNEANDIATLNSNYVSTLYDALLNQIGQRDQLRMNLMGQAQGIAGNMYDRWKAEEDAAKNRGGGGGGIDYGGDSPGRKKPKPPTNPLTGTEGFGDDLFTDETKTPATTGGAWTPPNTYYMANGDKTGTKYSYEAMKEHPGQTYRVVTKTSGTGSAGQTMSVNDDKIDGKLVTTPKTPTTRIKVTKTKIA